MGLVLTDVRNYEDIADALREHLGEGETFLPSEMADAIRRSFIVASPLTVPTTLSITKNYSTSVTTDIAQQTLVETAVSIVGSMFNATATGE